jgi:nitrite reductase (NADH) small subunit
VACPLHNWQIKLVDGVAHAPDVGCTTKFSVQVENGEVALDFDEVNTLALDV